MQRHTESTTWEHRARRVYAQVLSASLWTDDLSDAHYTGAGGAVHPDGTLARSLDPNDVAWESLWDDCVFVLSKAGLRPCA